MMNDWEAFKRAYAVGKFGTVTAAADSLGVHRATVIRNVESLEEELGRKLFLKHTNGYTPTELGEELVRVVEVIDEQFKQLSGKLKGQSEEISGEIVITSLEALAPILLPSIKEFQKRYKETQTTFIASEQVLKLEYGEAHIALRPGRKPAESNNKVIPYGNLKFGLYATREYLDEYGHPKNMDELLNHSIVCRYGHPRSYFERWVYENMPPEKVVLRGTTPFIFYQGILNHLGIGALASFITSSHPNLVEVFPTDDRLDVPLWLVVHEDMIHTAKVRAYLEVLKENNLLAEQ